MTGLRAWIDILLNASAINVTENAVDGSLNGILHGVLDCADIAERQGRGRTLYWLDGRGHYRICVLALPHSHPVVCPPCDDGLQRTMLGMQAVSI